MANLQFQSPSTFMIVGPSGSGKSTLVKSILEQKFQMFSRIPKHVILCYAHSQDMYHKMLQNGTINEMIENFPGIEEMKQILKMHKSDGSCLILDDSLTMIGNHMSALFTEFSSKYNTDIFILSQNLFFDHKEYRTLSL